MSKKIFCITLLVILTTAFTYSVMATSAIPNDLIERGRSVLTPDTDSSMTNIFSMVVKVIQYVGTGIALIVITIYGIKYMIASPSEKADVKKQIEPILIGCILLFGTVNIVALIASLAEGALGEGQSGTTGGGSAPSPGGAPIRSTSTQMVK